MKKYLLVLILLGCKRSTETTSDKQGKDSLNRPFPIDSLYLPDWPTNYDGLAKGLAITKRRVDTTNRRVDTVFRILENLSITTNPNLSSNQLKQVNSLDAAIKTSVINILKDSMKALATLRTQIAALQKTDAAKSLDLSKLKKQVNDTIVKNMVKTNPNDFWVDPKGYFSIKRKTGNPDSLINPPGK